MVTLLHNCFINYSFLKWTRLVDICADDYSWYLNSEGKLNLSDRPENLFKKGLIISNQDNPDIDFDQENIDLDYYGDE